MGTGSPHRAETASDRRWEIEIDQENPEAGIWLRCLVEEHWSLRVRLTTNGYRTVMSALRLEALSTAPVLGIRGAVELPQGETGQEWSRLPIHLIRMEATERLHQALRDYEMRAAESPNPFTTEPQPHSTRSKRRGVALSDVPLMQALIHGFTSTATRPRRDVRHVKGDLRLALVAAAYEAAAQQTRRPRDQIRRWLNELGYSYTEKTVAQLVRKARIYGFLGKADPGTVAGAATPRARALIEQAKLDTLPWEGLHFASQNSQNEMNPT
jgi:hypothetical protein